MVIFDAVLVDSISLEMLLSYFTNLIPKRYDPVFRTYKYEAIPTFIF
jgi:hypothetical protein